MTYYDSPINLAVSEASKIEQDIANDCIRIATKYSIDIDEKKLTDVGMKMAKKLKWNEIS